MTFWPIYSPFSSASAINARDSLVRSGRYPPAKTPPQIVERGKLGDTLVIEAVADKYVEHAPTERQSRRFSRAGVDIPPHTLGRSMAVAIDLFSPIAAEIKRETLASRLLGTDATGLPVLDQDHPQGIRNGTIWGWVGGTKWVTFFYARHGDAHGAMRRHEHPELHRGRRRQAPGLLEPRSPRPGRMCALRR